MMLLAQKARVLRLSGLYRESVYISRQQEGPEGDILNDR